MNQPFKKIMLVTNEASDVAGAEQTALNLAKSNNAAVVLVDSIRTPFHTAPHTPIQADHIFEMASQAKQRYLDEVKQRFVDEGIETSTIVLFGTRTSVEITATALAEKCDLVIRYLKGQSSRLAGRFGQTAENLMRVCPMPLLLVEKAIDQPKVTACVNIEHGPEENQAIIHGARKLAKDKQHLDFFSCWEFTSGQFLIDFVDQGICEQTIEEAKVLYQRIFDDFKEQYDVDDFEGHFHLVQGEPRIEIPKYCTENGSDVVVMCSASLNHPLGRNMGSTIEKVIQSLPCGLLVVKPIGFECPVKPAEDSEAISSDVV